MSTGSKQLREGSVSDIESDRRSVEHRLATCEKRLKKWKEQAQRVREYLRALKEPQPSVTGGTGRGWRNPGTGTVKAEYTGLMTRHGPGSAILKQIGGGGRTKRRRRGGRTRRRRRGGLTKRRRRGGRTKRRRRGGRRRTRRK